MYNYNLDPIKTDCEFKYYLLGLIASDGSISTRYNRIEITLKESDVSLLKAIRDVIVPGKKISYRQKHNAYRLTLDNKELHREICKYIDPGNKTQSLIFPYGISDQYVSHFVRGYIDGDGNISVKKGQRKFPNGIKYYYGLRLRVLGTRAFLYGLINNLFRLGITKNRVKPHKKGQENVFYIEYGFNQAKRVLDWSYDQATYKLDRKYKVFLQISNTDSDTLGRLYGTSQGHYNMQKPELSGKV